MNLGPINIVGIITTVMASIFTFYVLIRLLQGSLVRKKSVARYLSVLQVAAINSQICSIVFFQFYPGQIWSDLLVQLSIAPLILGIPLLDLQIISYFHSLNAKINLKIIRYAKYGYCIAFVVSYVTSIYSVSNPQILDPAVPTD